MHHGIQGFRAFRRLGVPQPAVAGCSEAEIAAIRGHSLKDAGAILDAHYMRRDSRMSDSPSENSKRKSQGQKLPTEPPTGQRLSGRFLPKSLVLLAGAAGLEPATYGFGDRRSTS